MHLTCVELQLPIAHIHHMECSMCGMIEFDPETHHARLERDKRVLCCLWVDVQETIRRTRVLAGEEPQ